MKRVFLAGEPPTIESIWNRYEFQSKLSVAAKNEVLRELANDRISADSIFSDMTRNEIDGFFDELDNVTNLSLLTAVEAAVRIDFLERIRARKKDALSKHFLELHRRLGRHVEFEKHILDGWKLCRPATKRAIGYFKGAWRLRNWLAHGRYWEPSFGQNYSTPDVLQICNAFLVAAGLI